MTDNKDIQKILGLEYAIFKLIEWILKDNLFKNIKEFEERNNFTEMKLRLLPFFLCTANGPEHRKAMFTIYNNFLATEEGYIESDVEQKLINLEYFIAKEGEPLKLKEEGLKFINESERIFDAVEFEKINKPVSLTVLPALNPKNNIYRLIDHSIKVYQKQEWNIYAYDENLLSRYSKKHSAWNVYNMVQGLRGRPVQTSMLVKEKSMFAENIDDRILM